MLPKLSRVIETAAREAVQIAAHLSTSGREEKGRESRSQRRTRRPDFPHSYWAGSPNWFNP